MKITRIGSLVALCLLVLLPGCSAPQRHETTTVSRDSSAGGAKTPSGTPAPPAAPGGATPTSGTALPMFPADWAGHWVGSCCAYRPAVVTPSTFGMELDIQPLGDRRYSWTLIYTPPGRRDVREYELVPVDADQGHWQIDEKNTIKCDSYLFGRQLFCQFLVESALITITYTNLDDRLVFDLVSADVSSVITSGSGTEAAPSVLSYPVNAVQHAELRRSEQSRARQ